MRAPPFLSILLGLPVAGLVATLAFCAIVDPFGLYRWFAVREGFNAQKPRQQSHERMVRAADLRRLKADAIILGTSRAQVGLDPDSPAWKGVSEGAANAAFSDGTPYEALRYLQHAHAISPVKTAVFGADYLSFVGGPRHSPDYVEDRLAIGKDGQPQRFFAWADAPSALLSLDALRISRRTVLEQHETSYFTDRGRRQPRTMEQRIVDQGGPRGAFVWSERDYADSYVCADPKRLEAHLKDFEAFVAFAKAQNIRLIVLTSPSHVRSLELLRAAGLWAEVERFKREVVRITSAAQVPFFEFNLPHAASTAEEVPPAGDKDARMKWYWESSHFNHALGDLALARVFGQPLPPDFAGWGIEVQPATLEQTLADVTAGVAAWAAAHPSDVKEIETVVAEARAAQVCRRL